MALDEPEIVWHEGTAPIRKTRKVIMARVTVEDCLEKVNDRFSLAVAASKRTKQLMKGSNPLSRRKDNKFVFTALRELAEGISQIDKLVEEVLNQQDKIMELAKKYQGVQDTFFLGRGFDYAVAMEGALKLKEISYVHAEAYAAGELKHGPLALIDVGVPVLALLTQDNLVEKTMSNIKEVKARGAVVVAICKESLQEACQECDEQILLPNVNNILAPMISVVPLQIFSYYMAIFRGADVDKPRNLAKSVTVE